MSITTDLVILAIGVSVVGGVAWKYKHTMDENKELKTKVETLTPVVTAHAESGEVKNEQTESIRKAESSAAQLARDVARLRKSVESGKKSSTDSIEACNRTLTVTGEVLGECTGRYTEVARKAELLKVDLNAMDKHADLLEGIISDITGMEPLK